MRRLSIVLVGVLAGCGFAPNGESSHDSGSPSAIDAPHVDAPRGDATSPSDAAHVDAQHADAPHADAPHADAATPIDAPHLIDAAPPPADASTPVCGGLFEACCAPDDTCNAGLRCGHVFHVCFKPL